ncbi:hypothetical protein PoB_000129200 [Plakobranchus ocellatus]|uniref:Uncharacterized protein n=1 Tax=Plakobranchus ocellatus TaxID=259542 RepID=A0AAV3XXB4_9GAST|nr:hypothetical protein PoB_000129200 [Plakobranchus ocellatus]
MSGIAIGRALVSHSRIREFNYSKPRPDQRAVSAPSYPHSFKWDRWIPYTLIEKRSRGKRNANYFALPHAKKKNRMTFLVPYADFCYGIHCFPHDRSDYGIHWLTQARSENGIHWFPHARSD